MKKVLSIGSAAAVFLLCAAGIGAAPPAEKPAAPALRENAPVSGKVLRILTGGAYTYALIEKNKKRTWVAAPSVRLTVGQEISFRPGIEMTNFESISLKQTFGRIIFSPGLAGSISSETATGKTGASEADEQIKVEKAQGPNAYTIAELLKNSAALDRKNIVVKGKVIKISEGVMGKNWVHLKDGSGDREEELVVTTHDVPQPGSVVTAGGTLCKDKDFGSGYSYAVIVEDATITR